MLSVLRALRVRSGPPVSRVLQDLRVPLALEEPPGLSVRLDSKGRSASPDLLVPPAPRVLKAPRVLVEQLASRVRLAPLVQSDPPEYKGQLVLKDPPAFQVPPDPLARRELRVLKGLPVLKAPQVSKVLQVSQEQLAP